MDKENRWQKKLEEVENNLGNWQSSQSKKSLTNIEMAVDGELAKLRAQMINDLVKDVKAEIAQDSPPICPNCQTQMQKNGEKKRELRTKDEQRIEIERGQVRCSQCGLTFFPPR